MKLLPESGHKKFFYLGLSLVLLLVIGAITTALLFKVGKTATDSDVLAMVAGVKITRSDLNKRIWSANPKGTPANPEKVPSKIEEQLLNTLIEEQILKYNADRLGITVTDKELSDRIKADGFKDSDLTPTRKPLIENATRVNILREKTQEKVVNWVAGDFIRVRFNRHFTDILGGTDAERAKDREYAQTLANQTYQDLAIGKITLEQAGQKIQNDTTIDIKTYPGNYGNQYGQFGKENWASFFLTESERNTVKAGAKNNWIKPFVGKLIMDNANQDLADGYFYIVRPTDSFKGEADTYNSWLNDQKNKLLNKQSAFAGVAYAEPYRVLNVDVQYYDYNNNLTPINGVYFQFTSNFSAAPCSGTSNSGHNLSTSYGTYQSYWNRDAAGAVHITRNYTDGGTTGYTCSVRTNQPSNYPLVAGCEHNNFVWRWGFSDTTLPEIKNGTIQSFYLANSANVGAGSNTDTNLAYLAVKTVLNDWSGNLTMRVRAKYYTLTTAVSPAGGGTVTGAGTYGPGTAINPAPTATPNSGYAFDHFDLVDTNTGAVVGSNVKTNPYPITINQNLTLTATFTATVTKSLSCNIEPQLGTAPLSVRVWATPSTGWTPPANSYNFNMGDGTSLSGRNSEIYFTYSSVTTDTPRVITITNSDAAGVQCQVNVTIKAPQTGGGGEVTP